MNRLRRASLCLAALAAANLLTPTSTAQKPIQISNGPPDKNQFWILPPQGNPRPRPTSRPVPTSLNPNLTEEITLVIVGPVLFPISQGGTDHWYEYVPANNITWTQACAQARQRRFQGKRGYLATLTYQEENAFVRDMLPTSSEASAWFGASDVSSEGVWVWKAGSPEASQAIGYDAWGPGQPSAATVGHDYARMAMSAHAGLQKGQWADADNLNTSVYVAGYVVEYGTNAPPPPNLAQWPGNGNFYTRIEQTDITWDQAYAAATGMTFMGMPGYLATITEQGENDFLQATFSIPAPAGNRGEVAWIGATDRVTEGEWRWEAPAPEGGDLFWIGAQSGSTVPPYNYANWNPSDPNNFFGQDHGVFTLSEYLQTFQPGEWGDHFDDGGGEVDYYIVEFGDADPTTIEVQDPHVGGAEGPVLNVVLEVDETGRVRRREVVVAAAGPEVEVIVEARVAGAPELGTIFSLPGTTDGAGELRMDLPPVSDGIGLIVYALVRHPEGVRTTNVVVVEP